MRKIGTIGKVNGKVIFKETKDLNMEEKSMFSNQMFEAVEKTLLLIGGFEI